MKVVWTDEAARDLAAIVAHVAADNPEAARRLAARIVSAVETILPEAPKAGRPGRVAGTRELLVHRTYIAAYSLSTDRIAILTVRHAARLWPDAL